LVDFRQRTSEYQGGKSSSVIATEKGRHPCDGYYTTAAINASHSSHTSTWSRIRLIWPIFHTTFFKTRQSTTLPKCAHDTAALLPSFKLSKYPEAEQRQYWDVVTSGIREQLSLEEIFSPTQTFHKSQPSFRYHRNGGSYTTRSSPRDNPHGFNAPNTSKDAEKESS
jgi:hypothetical protein